mmetsp:Transcript_47653/g.69677  ORF Transcript_47653/g.69677 Transcript_47653/m.69677 type:complete len:371 (+) Transcript_47653:485-1597(+)
MFKSLAMDDPKGYNGRGWCRLEMYLATSAPLKKDTYCYFRQKSILARADQRPHFLAGDHNNGLPFLLPPLANSVLRALNPVEGHLTCKSDLVHIETLVGKSPPPLEAAIGYWGERNTQGGPEGHGVEVLDSGTRYEGQFLGGEWHGHGVVTYANGDVCSGEYVRGLVQGMGLFRWASGDTYRGQWARGAVLGHGLYAYTDGGRHAGGFVDDLKSGPGVYVGPDCQLQEGRWERDNLLQCGNLQEGPCNIASGRRMGARRAAAPRHSRWESDGREEEKDDGMSCVSEDSDDGRRNSSGEGEDWGSTESESRERASGDNFEKGTITSGRRPAARSLSGNRMLARRAAPRHDCGLSTAPHGSSPTDRCPGMQN